MRNVQTDMCGPEETDKKVGNIQIRLWREFWTKKERNVQLMERQSVHMKGQKSTISEKLREIYFIDLEDKEFKEIIKNAPAIPCKMSRNNQNYVERVNPMRSNQKLRVSCKSVNLPDYVWKNSISNHHEDHIARKKETIHNSIIICFTNLFQWFMSWRFPQQNSSAWRLMKIGKDFDAEVVES